MDPLKAPQNRSSERLPKLNLLGRAAIFVGSLAVVCVATGLLVQQRLHRDLNQASQAVAQALDNTIEEIDRDLGRLAGQLGHACDDQSHQALIRASLSSSAVRVFVLIAGSPREVCGPLKGLDYSGLVLNVEPQIAPAAQGLAATRPAIDLATADSPWNDSPLEWAAAVSIKPATLLLRTLRNGDQLLAHLETSRLQQIVSISAERSVGDLTHHISVVLESGRVLIGATDVHVQSPALAPSPLSSSIEHRLVGKGLAVRAMIDMSAVIHRAVPMIPVCLLIALLITWLFSSNLNNRLMRRSSVEWRLMEAIRKRRFEPVLQPIVDAASGACVGAEVLMRWQHPVRGLLAPAEFIDFAERSGLIVPMSRMLMVKARDRLAVVLERRKSLYFSFNFTIAQLKQAGFVQEMQQIFSDDTLPLSRVVIEIIERDLIDKQAHEVLADLRQLGCRVAIDDFGTGQSSLALLESIDIDLLKIDREFVSAIDEATVNRPVLDAIIGLAQKMKTRMIAEGVETHSQRDYLRQHGVQSLQGYLIARPMPVPDFARWLDSNDDESGLQARAYSQVSHERT